MTQPSAAGVNTWLAIAVGGALGSLVRHGVNYLAHSQWMTTKFPIATVMVNVSGCFVIGLLAGLLAVHRVTLPFYWREFVFVGVLGGYTTFSTFGLDTFMLARTHSVGYAALNVVGQVVFGLGAVWMGYRAGSALG